MHGMHTKPSAKNDLETAGATLHHASRYDLHTSMLGFGANSRNSRMVIELANVKPGDRVLDVGCGTGNLTLTAQSYAGPSGQVYGIDASPEMIETAKKKAAHSGLGVVFDIGLIEKLTFPEATFDTKPLPSRQSFSPRQHHQAERIPRSSASVRSSSSNFD